MLNDGTYAAWYKTALDQGTGIVHVADGQIWGCDGLMITTAPAKWMEIGSPRSYRPNGIPMDVRRSSASTTNLRSTPREHVPAE